MSDGTLFGFGNIYLAGATIVLWIYALHCYRQALRHREPPIDPTDVALARPLRGLRLTARGEAYRKRFYWAALLGLLTFVLAFPSLD